MRQSQVFGGAAQGASENPPEQEIADAAAALLQQRRNQRARQQRAMANASGGAGSAAVKSEPTEKPPQRWTFEPHISMQPDNFDMTGAQAINTGGDRLALRSAGNQSEMSKRPIIQSPDNPQLPHPDIGQPAKINRSTKTMVANQANPSISSAFDAIDHYLSDPVLRADYESGTFSITDIKPSNLPAGLSQEHATVGMRGVTAQRNLPPGTPLIYSAQYVASPDYDSFKTSLSEHVSAKLGGQEFSSDDAEKLIGAYSWAPIKFKGKTYEMSAVGAGNVTQFINHDEDNPNMSIVYAPTRDASKRASAPIVVYITTRDIAAGEQLLVNYGSGYDFSENNLEAEIAPPAGQWRAAAAASGGAPQIKEEPRAASHNAFGPGFNQAPAGPFGQQGHFGGAIPQSPFHQANAMMQAAPPGAMAAGPPQGPGPYGQQFAPQHQQPNPMMMPQQYGGAMAAGPPQGPGPYGQQFALQYQQPNPMMMQQQYGGAMAAGPPQQQGPYGQQYAQHPFAQAAPQQNAMQAQQAAAMGAGQAGPAGGGNSKWSELASMIFDPTKAPGFVTPGPSTAQPAERTALPEQFNNMIIGQSGRTYPACLEALDDATDVQKETLADVIANNPGGGVRELHNEALHRAGQKGYQLRFSLEMVTHAKRLLGV